MLVLPVSGSSANKIPWATLLIILVNCMVFLGPQSRESDEYNRAFTLYHASGLDRIEYDAYRGYLIAKGEAKRLPDYKAGMEDQLYWTMLADRGFQGQLLQGELVGGETNFKAWQEKRQAFEAQLARIFSLHYGYSPFRHNYPALFTCMFLHGSLMHLAGNMVFLWFVGTLLEVWIGWRRFVPLYLVTGVCASLLFGTVYPSEMGPLIGASGAIAGLMGAYGLIFGRARIKIFYSLGFYFDYAKVPAWGLFPFWLGNEFFQLHTNTGSQVAYMAHIGGLLSGGLLGLVHKRLSGDGAAVMLQEAEQQDRVPLLIEEGLNHFAELRLAAARAKMVEALAIAPDNRTALHHLFTIDKCSPEKEEFHQTARQLLGVLAMAGQGEADEDLHTCFEEYRRLNHKPRLTPDIIVAIVQAYCRRGRLADASRMLAVLLKQSPNHGKVPGCLWTLGLAYQAGGEEAQGARCLKLLAGQYGGTAVGRRATERLLVSVRSGAAVSMPGMMATLHNVGLNEDISEEFAKMRKNQGQV